MEHAEVSTQVVGVVIFIAVMVTLVLIAAFGNPPDDNYPTGC